MKVKSIFIVIISVAALFFYQACNETSETSTSDEPGLTCATHGDCEIGSNCQIDEETGDGECLEDPNATECISDADCQTDLGYCCSFAPDQAFKCQPCTPVDTDGDDSDGDDSCETNSDCMPGFECDTNSGLCIPTGDDDDDDTTDDDDDTTDDDDDTTDDDDDTADDDDDTAGCATDADCTGEQICGPDGQCKEKCTTAGCQYGICNTNTGHCEFCSPACGGAECCNYSSTFWYCGSCCNPECPAGQACTSGRCVTPECPSSCAECEECSAATGWTCETIPGCTPTDGDTDTDRGYDCFATGAPCMEGVDECCSGTCLMGTCL